ncbi:MAG: hypothetical protein M1419_03435 [Bacteroidetes bacterium]|nr:hypothetical protein [Bacteroidota bacterium]
MNFKSDTSSNRSIINKGRMPYRENIIRLISSLNFSASFFRGIIDGLIKIEIINVIAKGNNAQKLRIVLPVSIGIETFISIILKIMQNPIEGIDQRGKSFNQPMTYKANINKIEPKNNNPENKNGNSTMLPEETDIKPSNEKGIAAKRETLNEKFLSIFNAPNVKMIFYLIRIISVFGLQLFTYHTHISFQTFQLDSF